MNVATSDLMGRKTEAALWMSARAIRVEIPVFTWMLRIYIPPVIR